MVGTNESASIDTDHIQKSIPNSGDSALDRGAKQSLTSSIIGRMIRRMCRGVLATLLIFGWISLSGFDLVEDLDEIPGQVAVSSASPKESSTLKVNGQAPLANNIIESANRIQDSEVSSTGFTPAIFHFVAVLDFRRHSQLHKLYRVFLI